MIDHFNKQTPLRGLPAYSTIESQIARFLNAGWHDIQATDLWSLWQNVNFMSDVDRVSLDKVEPFDEWEGLALFAGHYLLLLATTAEAHASAAPWKQALMSTPVAPKLSSKPMKRVLFDATDIPKGNGRLNGAVLKVDKSSFIHCGGMVNSACQGPGDFYSLSDKRRPSTLMPHVNLSCQTITPLEDGSSLLVGGRTSPLQASSKCYLFENDQWTQVADLQPGRYRHCAVPISICGKLGVLVFGGKTGSGEVLDHWSLFLDHQWHEVAVTGDQPPGLFGAAIVATGSASGFLVGGLSKNGRFHSSAKGAGLWYWSLQEMGPESIKLNVAFTPVKDAEGSLSESLPRFGAVAVRVGPGVLLIGGVGPRGPLRHGEEIILLRNDGTVVPCEPVLSEIDALPMFVGHSIKRISDDELIMVGGGTVCFSFGAFWNSKTYSLVLGDLHKSPGKHWKLLSDLRKVMDDKHSSINVGKDSTQGTIDSRITQTSNNLKMQGALKGDPVQRISELPTVRENVHRFTARPVVIRCLNLGLCTSLWTKDYLKEKIGPSTPTIIHAASSPHLSFRDKNFVYETVAFNSFLDDAFAGSHVYMRALSTSKPSKAPANLAIDYPALAVDFKIPDELKFAEQHQHSSVLRISGDVNMWLHYDVMSNVLCQVSGSKRVILFPPKDISYLDFPAGNTTSNLDVFTADARKFANCSPMETALSAGEVHFIPACCPHATAPSPDPGQDGLSVAVNVFFKSFAEKLYAAGRDVYGNRDLEMYQNGRKHVEKIRGLFNGQDPQGTAEKIMTLAQKLRARERAMEHDLGGKDVNRIIASTRDVPDDIARFYLARLADELMDCPKQP
jgi:tRNA wybutosine-synthesizing protein 4